ncbi:hypothetical protein EVAR_69282_1 [Eumeta japonica]|uniref:Uncharacterized protein n=1 Tax=Eumeta variegata TaxID=151549 RepID=A0A4C1STX2_EUMVA|nr:hypothetical protein EVAR_69282_1 [Eumeta japonica]
MYVELYKQTYVYMKFDCGELSIHPAVEPSHQKILLPRKVLKREMQVTKLETGSLWFVWIRSIVGPFVNVPGQCGGRHWTPCPSKYRTVAMLTMVLCEDIAGYNFPILNWLPVGLLARQSVTRIALRLSTTGM